MLNRVTLIGNLGRDPEVRSTQSGDSVANLSLATTERWKDRNSGEKRERTEWHRLTLWGALADVAGKYLAKGSKVCVEGKLETRKWQKDGQDRYTTEIRVTNLVMLDAKKQDSAEDYQAAKDGNYDRAQQGPNTDKPADFDDEIPF